MTRLAFDKDDIERWLFDISLKAPTPVAHPNDETITKAVSIGLWGVRTGLVVKFATESGAEIALKLNPVVAHHLAHAIRMAGEKMDWMDNNGDITCPILDD